MKNSEKNTYKLFKERETPFRPRECTYVEDEPSTGICNCGRETYSFENYCSSCGQKLDWDFKKEEFILPNAKVTKFLVSNELNTEVFDNLQEAVEYFNPMIAPCYLMFECGGKIFIIEEK
jgi:hypothetical protein